MIFSKRFIWFFVFLGINIILLLGIDSQYSNISKVFISSTHMLRVGLGHSIQKIQDVVTGFHSNAQLQNDNESLKKELHDIKESFKSIDVLRHENQKLKELLQFRYSVGYDLILSNIIISTTGEGQHEYIVDSGSKHGVKKGMIVCGIFEQRLVLLGRIVLVFPRTSIVQSIQQNNIAFGIITSISQQKGILKGNNDTLSIIFNTIYEGSEVLVGEEVYVNEYSTLFPRGIPVGSIVSITTNSENLLLTSEVEPFINIEDVSTVLIMRANQELQ